MTRILQVGDLVKLDVDAVNAKYPQLLTGVNAKYVDKLGEVLAVSKLSFETACEVWWPELNKNQTWFASSLKRWNDK